MELDVKIISAAWIHFVLGKGSIEKKRFLSGIAQIT